MIGDDNPDSAEYARLVGMARQWVDSGDYLAAIHALGDLEVRLTSRETSAGGPARIKPADVEQALGDLRRAIKTDAERPGTAQAQSLWSAAREEFLRGSWTAAMSLIKEAHERLAKQK